MKKLMLAVSLLLLSSFALASPTMGIVPYAKARSVKVCAIFDGYGSTCGTALFVGPNKLVTKAHIFPTTGATLAITPFGLQVSTFPLTMVGKPFALRTDDGKFSEATLVSSSTVNDLAVLTTSFDSNPQVLFENQMYRDENVVVIGNPHGGDFEATKTQITSVNVMMGEKGVRTLIGVDSQEGRIRPGYSGGGVFDMRGGMLGTIESCDDEQCYFTPSKVVQQFLKENK